MAAENFEIWSRGELIATVNVHVLGALHHKNLLAESVDCLITTVSHGRQPSEADGPPIIYSVSQTERTILTTSSFGSDQAYNFLVQIFLAPSTPGFETLIRLIVPSTNGYISRSDIIPLRLQDCTLVDCVKSFAKPLQCYQSRITSHFPSVSTVVEAATAGILARRGSLTSLDALRAGLDQELENRLSFPWIIPDIPTSKTLALVKADGAHLDYEGIGLTRAAAALGIRLIVLEVAGHWLEQNTTLIDAFLPLRLNEPPTEDMTKEILASLKTYGKPIDGIVTFADTYWPYVAAAATIIGLQTATPEALKVATNKYETSVYAGQEAYHASSLGEALEVASKHHLSYPLIVKPCGGWSSEGVSRVNTLRDLEEAVKLIIDSQHGPNIVIEPYCDGPEVDVNFVLQDGEVLFDEICDDPPKTADINGPTMDSPCSFHELYDIYPSNLPQAELQLIRAAFLKILLSLGLRNGVFHLEGRIADSSVEYVNKDGIMDLSKRAAGPENQHFNPKPWLIEINVRPPGMTSSQIMESTYGVDYWGLSLLSAIGDKKRTRALAQPFANGPQYTAILVFISADFPLTCRGIFDSDDVCADLIARRPDLRPFISQSGCLLKRGERVPHPSTGRNTFVAYFNVFSRISRAQAQSIAEEVRAAVRYTFQ